MLDSSISAALLVRAINFHIISSLHQHGERDRSRHDKRTSRDAIPPNSTRSPRRGRIRTRRRIRRIASRTGARAASIHQRDAAHTRRISAQHALQKRRIAAERDIGTLQAASAQRGTREQGTHVVQGHAGLANLDDLDAGVGAVGDAVGRGVQRDPLPAEAAVARLVERWHQADVEDCYVAAQPQVHVRVGVRVRACEC